MNELTETIINEINSVISKHINDTVLKSNSTAAKVLKEIQEVVISSNIVDGHKSDFDIVEEIVCIFEKYGIDAGGCHDF